MNSFLIDCRAQRFFGTLEICGVFVLLLLGCCCVCIVVLLHFVFSPSFLFSVVQSSSRHTRERAYRLRARIVVHLKSQ